ncbi:MAG: hypothetical protein ACRC6H_10700 [Culicoidibacterales bacterium]
MEILSLLIVGSTIIVSFKIFSKRWRRRKCLEEMMMTLRLEHLHYFTQDDTKQLFSETVERFKMDKHIKRCYHEIVDRLAEQYEQKCTQESKINKYDELAHLYQLLQLGVDDQYHKRTFATLFMKIRNYT